MPSLDHGILFHHQHALDFLHISINDLQFIPFLLVFVLVELKNECLRKIIFSIEKFYTTYKFVLYFFNKNQNNIEFIY